MQARIKLEEIFSDLMIGEQTPVEQRTRVNCLSWDSLMQLNLITAIEQEFGISITDDDAVDMSSFSSTLHILEEKLARV